MTINADSAGRWAVIGIGNDFRGDDGVGLWIARQLKRLNLKNVEILESDGDSTGLMEWFHQYRRIILLDAISSASPPGTIHFLDAGFNPLPADFRVRIGSTPEMFAAARYPMPVNFLRCSSHQLGIMESIELFRILNILPPHLYIYGIEGKEYDSPFHLSNEVRLSVDLLIAQLVKMIRSPLFRD